MEFDFVGKIRFIEQRLWDPDPPRVADPDDARSRGHCDYSVATSSGVWQERRNRSRAASIQPWTVFRRMSPIIVLAFAYPAAWRMCTSPLIVDGTGAA